MKIRKYKNKNTEELRITEGNREKKIQQNITAKKTVITSPFFTTYMPSNCNLMTSKTTTSYYMKRHRSTNDNSSILQMTSHCYITLPTRFTLNNVT